MDDPGLPNEGRAIPNPIEQEGGEDSAQPVIVRQMMAMMSGSFASNEQILDKLDKKQLDKVIDQGEAADKRAHERFVLSNRSNVLIAIVGIVGLIVLIFGLAWIFLSHGNAAELREIIALFLGAGIGGAGGFGFGLHKGKQQSEL